jgi:hypothetical protein
VGHDGAVDRGDCRHRDGVRRRAGFGPGERSAYIHKRGTPTRPGGRIAPCCLIELFVSYSYFFDQIFYALY